METSEQTATADSQPQKTPQEKMEAMFLKDFGGASPEEPKEQQASDEQPAEQAAEQSQEPETRADSEMEEVEVDGETYQVPSKLKPHLTRYADYTRKTQELAEARRVVASQEQSLKLQNAFQQEISQETNQLAAIRQQIEQYKKLDWQSMETEQLVRTKHAYDQLREMEADLDKAVQGKRQAFDEKVRGLQQEAREAGLKFIQQKIKGFNDEKAKQLMSYGVAEGYTKEELESVMDPRIVVTLWKAAQWDQLQAGKPQIVNKASQAAPVVKPGAAQKPVSHKQILQKQIRESKDPKAKARAAEEYFASVFK